jgi:HPt (histidine-containing phosphotransfer) domain-containing protein
MDDYMSKPLREEELTATLRRWLPDKTRRANATAPVKTEAAPSVPTQLPFDLDKLRRTCRNDAAQVTEMLRLFVESTEALLASHAEAAARREVQLCARHAHQIKGAAAYLGAAEILELAGAAEQAAKDEDWEALLGWQEDLEAAFIRLKRVIEAYI